MQKITANLKELLIIFLAMILSALVVIGGEAGLEETCTPPPIGIVSWWSADGSAVDVLGGNNGNAHNVSYTSGHVDQAFLLDGELSHILVPDSNSNPLDGYQAMTVEGWINPDSFGWPNPDPNSDFEAAIISKYDSTLDTGVSYQLSLSDGHLRFVVVGYGIPRPSASIVSNSLIELKTWSHVTGVWRGQEQLALFINGAPISGTVNIVNSPPTKIAENDTMVNIGRIHSYSGSYVGPAAFFDGLLDEITLYDRGLSPSEIASIFNSVGKCKDDLSNATPTSTATVALTITATPTAIATPTPLENFLPVVVRPKPASTTATPTPSPTPTLNWLGHLNSFRDLASLPHVTENPEWSYGCWLHARYAVKNDHWGHTEDPDLPWYTPEGLACAQNSNLFYSFDKNATDQEALDVLMTALFHGLGMIDPALRQTGFGSYREADGGYQMSAANDVIRGNGKIPSSVSFPIMWPGPGSITPLSYFPGYEYPNPLTSCPGYSKPTGSPIFIQIGSGNRTPKVSNFSVTYAGTVVHGCIFDETSYLNPDSVAQDLGRAILDARDAIIFLPQNPLVSGAKYNVSVSTNGEFYSWSFSVADNPRKYIPDFPLKPYLIE